MSPVDLFYAFFITSISFTFLYHYFFPERLKFDFYNLDSLNKRNFTKNILVFLNMLLYFSIGVMLFTYTHPKYIILNKKKELLKTTLNFKINYSLILKISQILLFVIIILVFLDYGTELFIRKKYIPKNSSIYKTIYSILLVILSITSGILIKKKKSFSIISLIIIVTIGISLGSRMATVDLYI